MEQYAFKDLTLRIFREVLDEDEFRDWPDVGIAIQAYLRDSATRPGRLWPTGRERRGTPVWVRLVKGAYWDYETVMAAQQGWPVPVFTHKWETDANYETLTRFLLENHAAAAAGLRQPQRPQPGACPGRWPRCSDVPPTRLRIPDALRHGRRRSRTRWWRWASASASTRPTANCCRAWRTWCGGCWRTPPTNRSCGPASPNTCPRSSCS